MWYIYEGEAGIGGGLIPLSPDRVREIIRMNKAGKKPADLLEVQTFVEKEPDYGNVVGQDSVNRFEHIFKKKQNKRRNPGNRRGKAGEQKQTNTPKNETESGNKQSNRNRNRNRNRRRNRPNNNNNEGKQ